MANEEHGRPWKGEVEMHDPAWRPAIGDLVGVKSEDGRPGVIEECLPDGRYRVGLLPDTQSQTPLRFDDADEGGEYTLQELEPH